MNDEFRERLRLTFDYATMAEIARQVGIPHATVRNYFGGRLPAPEVLMKIAAKTGISLNWLLLGTGEMYLPGARPVDFDKLLEDKINAVIDRRLGNPREESIHDLGAVDRDAAFDVESAVNRSGDPERVLNEWFMFEGREYPQDYGVIFFQGWNTFTDEEKVDAVRDAKSVLDRSLKKK
jgi:AcrR family transcriptional regulator